MGMVIQKTNKSITLNNIFASFKNTEGWNEKITISEINLLGSAIFNHLVKAKLTSKIIIIIIHI